MIRWRGTALAFGALPELGALLLAAEAAFVFARDGSRLLFANPAAGRVFDASGFAALSERFWEEGDPLRRSVASLARALPEEGTLARLRLTASLPALPVLCRCSPVRAGAERGILVKVLERVGAKPTLKDLAAFFTGPASGAAIIDARGGVVAEGAPGVAETVTAATPSVEFSEAGQPLRLYVVERTDEARMPVFEDTSVPLGALDGPGLSTIGVAPREEAHEVVAPRLRSKAMEPTAPPASVEPQPEVSPPASRPPKVVPVSAKAAPPREKPVAPARPVAEAPARVVSAGRVPQELSRKPVRFLWQTDAADRFLFLSPGLAQVVGRNADIVGERWQEASARLRLDPGGRIARALRQRDTWSGLTAWWPIEGSNVRVPVELTALPVFAADQSFQGYRGFGILRPAEALMPATFESRFGSTAANGEPQPPYEESPAAKVVPIRADLDRIAESERLTAQERNAFEEIAAALRDRIVDGLAGGDGVRGEEEGDGEPGEPDAPAPRSLEEDRQAPAADPRIAPLNEQLAEARRRLREMTAILDTATDGVVVLDAEGIIESVNASAEALFGLDAHEMVDRQFADLLRPESRESALDYLSGLRDNGVASLLNEGREVEAAAGAGSIPLFMTMGRISSEEGQRFCAVLRDITHWKRIESELTAAKRAAEDASTQKSEFLGRVGNEIRAPLNAIIGFAEAMTEERFGPIENERYREHLREIRAAGEEVVNLVNDLLDVSRVEAGKLDLDFSAVPLNAVVQEGMALVQAQANRARVVLRSSLSREVPAIVGDERTLRQIVLNLLSHAVRHAGAGGQVIVSTSLSESGEALLRIRDTGHGMSEEEVKRALEPFRDFSIASLVDRSGTGLGLPLTKALVEANRATLSIKSARGEGTVMTVTIPPTRVLSE